MAQHPDGTARMGQQEEARLWRLTACPCTHHPSALLFFGALHHLPQLAPAPNVLLRVWKSEGRRTAACELACLAGEGAHLKAYKGQEQQLLKRGPRPRA